MTGTAQHFANNAKTGLMVQSTDDGWRDYLSERETVQLQKASKGQGKNILLSALGISASVGIFMFAAPSIAAVAGIAAAACFGANRGMEAIERMTTQDKLTKLAKRREGDVEVARKHGVSPSIFTPQ